MTDSHSAGDSTAEESGDETKRKFRDALNRKNVKASSGTEHRDGGAKGPRTHGSLENRREFRRKSG